MKEDEKLYYCKSFFECKRCCGYAYEKWKGFDCENYDNSCIYHGIKIVSRSEPITYFEFKMREKIKEKY